MRCIKTRNNLKRLCDKYPDITELVNKYKKYRNKLREIIRRAEDEYIKKSLESSSNPREAWQVINNDIRGKIRKRIVPTTLEGNNDSSRKALDDCNLYFSEIGKKLAESNGEISSGGIYPYTTKTKLKVFIAPDISKILSLIYGLKNGKAPGYDQLKAETLKNNSHLFAAILQHLIQISFASGQYPQDLKNALVTLVHKNGDPEDIANYRPISLLSVLNKIIEELIVEQLTDHLEHNNILAEYQFGFRSGRGTQQAVCALQGCIQEALDANEHPVVVFLDYSRAFDTVHRERLLAKLESMGVQDKALLLLRSYLQQRTQCIKVGSCISENLVVNYGVPQGGTIAPILFTAYVNDLLLNTNAYENRIGYADDTCIIFRFKNSVSKELIEKTLEQVQRWSSANGLLLNHKKSNYITFGNQLARFREPLTVHSQAQCSHEPDCTCPVIENVTQVNYLGMVIDEKLTWSAHVEKLKPKLRAALACISKIRRSVSLCTVKAIYKALFETHLRYGLLAYGAAFPTILMPLETLQNICLRRMLKANPMESSEPLYARTDILPLKKIYLEANLLHFNMRDPKTAAQLREQYRRCHEYQTRAASANKLAHPKCRLERTRRLHKNQYLHMLNYLPAEIRDNTKLKISEKKKLIHDFVKRLSREKVTQLREPSSFG